MSENMPPLTQLHLGVGAFHRAHQAMFLQELHNRGDNRWQIIGGNIRPDMQSIMETLQSQDCTYTLETVTPNGQRSHQEISSIRSIIDWDSDMQGISEVGARPDTRIISFTVTEAGYYLDEHDRLDETQADLKSDISGETRCTLYGAITAVLEERKRRASGPVTLLNCDNLRNNGIRFFQGLQQYLKIVEKPELLQWVISNTSSPNSMVDRITPRPPPGLKERVWTATGKKDSAPVMSEAFIQWVIEDEFIAGRPNWETVGVEMVTDVTPYEEAKIRILNASHSCLAWAGTLRGKEYIHEDMSDPEIVKIVHDYITYDVIPCLKSSESSSGSLDLAAYRDIVLERFGNPNVQDTNQRVAMDAFSKIPGFIVPTIQQALTAGRSADAVMMLPALFLAFIQREQRGEIPYQYHDQSSGLSAAKKICSANDITAAFCSERLLFGQLAGDQRLLDAMYLAVERVKEFLSKGEIQS